MIVELSVKNRNGKKEDKEIRVGRLQLDVLKLLAKEGAQNRQQLSKALKGSFIGCGCLGHIADKKKVEKGSLLAKGLVTFTPAKEAGKAATYTITSQGKKALEVAEAK